MQRQEYKLRTLNVDSIPIPTITKDRDENGDRVDGEPEARTTIRPTMKRYVILLLFCLNTGNKAFQYMQVPAGTSKFSYYYDVNNLVINSLAVLFMVFFLVLSWPACYLIRRIGLRKTILVTAAMISAGSIMKCFSCHEDRLYLLFGGQILVALAEQLIFSLPTRLASVWFPDHQVSTAVALCIFGNQLGMSLSFIVTQTFLSSATTRDEIGQQIYNIFLITAIYSALILFADLILFDEEPKNAPGKARLRQINKEDLENEQGSSFSQSMKYLGRHILSLLKNKDYNLITITYGIIVGLGFAVSSVLNQMLEPLWPNDDMLIGDAGFILIVSGALGLPLWGRVMDLLHRYLLMNVFLTTGTTLALCFFGYAINYMDSQLAIYISAGSFGLFQTGIYASGLELATELTYPAPELVTSSFMNVHPHVCGTLFIYLASYIVDNYGALYTNIFYIICSLFALISLLFIKERLKRQEAVRAKLSSETNDNRQQIPIAILGPMRLDACTNQMVNKAFIN